MTRALSIAGVDKDFVRWSVFVYGDTFTSSWKV